MVCLKAERASRLDFVTLDFETNAFFKNRVGAPWMMRCAMQLGRFMSLGAQAIENFSDVLCVITVSNQQRI